MKIADSMHALLVLPTGEQDSFWKTNVAAPHVALAQARRLAPALSDLETRVVLEDDCCASILRAAGWATGTAPAPIGGPRWLPHGAAEALGQLPPTAPVLVADLRCLGISAETITKLRKAWACKPDSVMILAEAPKNHPCQLQRHYLIQHMGYVVLFESWDKFQGVHVAKTRPFILPAPTLSPETNVKHAWNLASLLTQRPQFEADFPRALAAGRAVCIFGTDGRATALLPQQCLPDTSGGAELSGVALTPNGQPEAVVELQNERAVFRLLEAQRHPEERLSLHFVSTGNSFDLTYRADGPCELPNLPSASGIPYTLLREVRHGSTDYTSGIQQELNLWRHYGDNLVTGDSGAIIHGRQAFPKCVQLAPGLCMGRVAHLLSASPGSLRLLFTCDGLARVRNHVDHLRHGHLAQSVQQEPAIFPARPYNKERNHACP